MNVSETISSYRKRRKTPTPLVIGLLAVILVLVGIIILILGFSGRNGFTLFATDTPTPTITPSPTNTSTPTETSTITPTATNTLTPTPSAPYQYVIQQGDYLEKIATDHGLGETGVVLILLLNPYNSTTGTGIEPIAQTIYVGQTIWLPPPGMSFPTSTPWPTGIAPGTKIVYFVLPGDSLGSIARKCNSTIAAIVAANKDVLTDGETTVISPGWLLLVPINLVTPVPTAISTATPSLTPTP
jgi:LysM repeat protein